MLSLGWKIFKVLNYIQLIYSIGMGGFITYLSFFKINNPDSSYIPYLFILSFIILLSSSLFNIYVTDKFLPDKPLTGPINTSHYIFLLLIILISLGFILLIILGIIDLVNTEYQPVAAWIFLAGFLVMWIINLFIIIKQFQLKPYIRKNYQKSFSSLIESIGNT